jgi:hypothetical protein
LEVRKDPRISSREAALVLVRPGLAGTRLVPTDAGVKALIGQNEPLDGPASYDMRRDDFVEIVFTNVTVPDFIGIDDHSRPVLALVQASGFVRSNCSMDAVFGQSLLQLLLETTLTIGIATAARMVFLALVRADKDVLEKLRHSSRLQQRHDQSMAPTRPAKAGRWSRASMIVESVRRR